MTPEELKTLQAHTNALNEFVATMKVVHKLPIPAPKQRLSVAARITQSLTQ